MCLTCFIFRNRADPLNTEKAVLSVSLYGGTLSAVVLRIESPVDVIGIAVKLFFSDDFVSLHDCKYLQVTFHFNVQAFLLSQLRSWLFKGREHTHKG